MYKLTLFLLSSLFLGLFACDQTSEFNFNNAKNINNDASVNIFTYEIDSSKTTLSERFVPNSDFKRVKLDSNSFGFYLRNINLFPLEHIVKYYNGAEKPKRDIYCSVIDQEIDPVDLQQCADAVMRLRGEYLFAQKRYKDIHFNFLSDGKPRYFKDYGNGNFSYPSFRKYMKHIFSYANTGSLHDELIAVGNIKDIQPGDVFIQKRTPYGHAVTVMDVVVNSDGEKQFILSQSYMPAQETQILLNPDTGTVWFEAKEGEINTPEWTFISSDLRRFKE